MLGFCAGWVEGGLGWGLSGLGVVKVGCFSQAVKPYVPLSKLPSRLTPGPILLRLHDGLRSCRFKTREA